MLIHYTHKANQLVSVTLEQEATEPKTLWARAAASFIREKYPDMPLSKLLRCPINTAGPRAATLTIELSVLESPDGEL